MTKRIKDTYQKHLWIFVSANVVIFWVVSLYSSFHIEAANLKFSELLDQKSILFIMSPIITLVISGLISNPIKEFLVFWRIRNRLPGCRAFTKFAREDQRVDITLLKIKIGAFPEEPSEQNRLWYKLYKGLKEDEIVTGSHRDFLLTRDLCSISFLFAVVLGLVGLFLLESTATKLTYVGFLLLQYLITSVSARNFGNRFVCNVLAIASKEDS
jgi:hypothetical protein